MTGVLQDLHYALRGLMRSPGFTSIAVLTLGIGIAFNTSMFTLIDAVLLRSLPVERPEQLVNIYTSQYTEPYQTSSYQDYLDLRSRNSVMADMLAFSPSIAAVRVGERSSLALGEVVTGNYFRLLGLKPALGRLLSPLHSSLRVSLQARSSVCVQLTPSHGVSPWRSCWSPA